MSVASSSSVSSGDCASVTGGIILPLFTRGGAIGGTSCLQMNKSTGVSSTLVSIDASGDTEDDEVVGDDEV